MRTTANPRNRMLRIARWYLSTVSGNARRCVTEQPDWFKYIEPDRCELHYTLPETMFGEGGPTVAVLQVVGGDLWLGREGYAEHIKFIGEEFDYE